MKAPFHSGGGEAGDKTDEDAECEQTAGAARRLGEPREEVEACRHSGGIVQRGWRSRKRSARQFILTQSLSGITGEPRSNWYGSLTVPPRLIFDAALILLTPRLGGRRRSGRNQNSNGWSDSSLLAFVSLGQNTPITTHVLGWARIVPTKK